MNIFSIRNKKLFGSYLLNLVSFFCVRWAHLLRIFSSISCAFALGICTFNVAAAEVNVAAISSKEKAPIEVILKQFKVVKGESGNVNLVDVKAVMPGDVLEYRAVYSNRGATALPVVATLPIPDSLEYLKDSANANAEFAHTVALKDSRYSKEPLVQKILTASGATVSQPFPYAAYRYVRWDLGNLSPGKSVELSVRVKVSESLAVDARDESKVATVAPFPSINK